MGVHGIATVNPCSAWIDKTGRSIKLEAIVFHELAEVFAKVEFGWQWEDAHKQAGLREEVLLRNGQISIGSAGGPVIGFAFSRMLRRVQCLRGQTMRSRGALFLCCLFLQFCSHDEIKVSYVP
jgi:hypothetical protein